MEEEEEWGWGKMFKSLPPVTQPMGDREGGVKRRLLANERREFCTCQREALGPLLLKIWAGDTQEVCSYI
ncbi:hypothetical protein E2C01_049257 [Portunus trituberculatus]|uniref:Uncharacterized protein n=1 Tax=Portunus trituberculatus TaxID=210409 RepID=A0A5B7GD81_PORTR|nr:hypothetical protein [Portunus trituberculatus]